MTRIGSFYPAVFLSYTFFFIFALFNILTGVFVERAVAASLPDREELISEERKKLFQQVEDLRNLFKALDTDGSGKITKAEFINDMKDDRIVSYMNMIGLEMHDAEHFFDIIADDCEEVDIDAFIEHSEVTPRHWICGGNSFRQARWQRGYVFGIRSDGRGCKRPCDGQCSPVETKP
eukprot:symbB.v1.2.017028.t1/scaffold1285.1/size129168/7